MTDTAYKKRVCRFSLVVRTLMYMYQCSLSQHASYHLLLRLRTADVLPLRSCCQPAHDWCTSDEPRQAQQEPSVLETLATAAKEDAKEFHGLSVYEGLLVSKPSDYQALSPEIFKFLKEDLSLASHLPKAPSLGEYSFLLSKKANLATELFNVTTLG